MLYNGQKINTQKYVIDLAREQRINLTESEKIMWSKLKINNFMAADLGASIQFIDIF